MEETLRWPFWFWIGQLAGDKLIYWISYLFIKILGKIYFPFTVRGRENIPPKGGFIFASNHLSNLDPFLIGLSVRRTISYMAKDSLFRNRAFGFFLRKVHAFPVKREGPDIGALRETIRRLKAGSPLVVFPEGTRKGSPLRSRAEQGSRSVDAKRDTVNSGIGFLAAKSRKPVVPVYITGSCRVLPPKARRFKRHPITVAFGPPFVPARDDSYASIAREIMKRINSLSKARGK